MPRNSEAAASRRSKEAFVLLQPTVSDSKGVLTKQQEIASRQGTVSEQKEVLKHR